MTCTHQRPTRRFEVEGDLTVYTAAAQKLRLLSELRVPYTVIEVDLVQVTEIDTAGLQLLLLGCNIAMTLGGSLRLLSPTPAVREVIELLRLEDVFARAAAHCPNCCAESMRSAGAAA